MLNFLKEGKGKNTLLLLHGWPGDLSRWDSLVGHLKDKFTIYRLDLPGWGKTPLSCVYTITDYANDVGEFIKKYHLKTPVIVGHSFGGRVGVKLAALHPELISKLILVCAAGIERKNLRVRLIKNISPLIPDFVRRLLLPFFGSKDYLQTNGIKRKTFVNVVSENLEPDLAKIHVSTLLIWGNKDNTTPLWQGKLMNKLISHSNLIIIDGGDHGIPYRRADETAKLISNFL